MTSTETFVIETQDIDCDGIGHAFHRASAPKELVDEFHVKTSEYNDIDIDSLREGYFVELSELDPRSFNIRAEAEDRLRRIEKVERKQRYLAGYVTALQFALLEVMTPDGEGWGHLDRNNAPYILNEGEAAHLEERILEEAPGDWNYWQEQGYHSYLARR